jgi:cysteine desulfurase
MKRVYLDWASAAPVSVPAKRAFLKAMESFGNPSSPHAEGVQARSVLEEARKMIARLAAVKADGVIFTSGATEANALAIRGHIRALTLAGRKLEDMHLLYLPTAHSSVVETMEDLRAAGAQVEPLILTAGAIDLATLKTQLRAETVLVSMDVVCGETGAKYDTRDVRRVLDVHYESQRLAGRARALLHVDASQAPFTESIDCNHLGADLMTLDAQKVGGVRGVGALIRAHTSQAVLPLAPITQGGGQEFGLRPGTENPALAIAFATALSEVQKSREEFTTRASEARTAFLASLEPLTPVINTGKEFSPHIINLSFIGRDTDYAVMLLSKAGYAVSTKSACETDVVGSRVVFTMTGEEARALSTLRISWGPSTNTSVLQKFAQELAKTIHFLDAHSL